MSHGSTGEVGLRVHRVYSVILVTDIVCSLILPIGCSYRPNNLNRTVNQYLSYKGFLRTFTEPRDNSYRIVAEAHLYLAQHYYELRMQEIRAEIEEKEEKFRFVSHLSTDHDAVSGARKLTPIPSLLPSCSVYCDALTPHT